MAKKIYFTFFLLFLVVGGFAQTTLFDAGWKFYRGGVQGGEMTAFDDSKWRSVDLPHDWSIEDLPGTQTPFEPDAVSQVSGGFTTGGTGWYRKQFSLPSDKKNERVLIQFDGVYMNSDIWINSKHIINHPYGYTSFWLDITDNVNFEGKNTIAVQVKNEGANSRWYSGSGIYRHVWLKFTDPVHIAPWGIYITSPDVKTAEATLNIKTNVSNETANGASIKVVNRIRDSKGNQAGSNEVTQNIQAGTTMEYGQSLKIPNPQLWSPETPTLYTVTTEIFSGAELLDKTETKYGIRTISFDVDNGFRLNGKTIKLKGGCIHHDNGPLGSRAYDRAEERRVEILKQSGFNAIRSAHNPPSPAFLDACDRLGMLVIDEAFDMWRIGNNPYDYHLYFDQWWKRDVESLVFRDRNHPSVVIWSIGNEIRDMENPQVIEVAKMLGSHIREIEPTRPVTAAVNNLRPQKDPFFATLDISGYNYAVGGDHMQKSIYVQDHERVPGRVMVGTESYPMESFEAWKGVADNTWVIGDFVWTAFDYIGEASIGWRGYWQEKNFYPWNLAYCGDIDICGWRRPASFYRDALWKENQLSVFVKAPVPTFPFNPNKQSWSKWEWHDVLADWNWKGYEGRPLEVVVYSSCEEVELFSNGKSRGKKITGPGTKYIASWPVTYMKGELKAVGYKGKKIVNTAILQSTDEPVALKISSDAGQLIASGEDLAYITIDLNDANGRRNPKAENLVKFEIEGPGEIIAVGNGNPMSIESNQLPQRKAWQGRCLVIVKSTDRPGTIKLTALSEGLPSSTVSIRTK